MGKCDKSGEKNFAFFDACIYLYNTTLVYKGLGWSRVQRIKLGSISGKRWGLQTLTPEGPGRRQNRWGVGPAETTSSWRGSCQGASQGHRPWFLKGWQKCRWPDLYISETRFFRHFMSLSLRWAVSWWSSLEGWGWPGGARRGTAGTALSGSRLLTWVCGVSERCVEPWTYERVQSASHSVGSNSATPWTVALQAPLPMEFSRQEYWSGLPCPPPGEIPDPGIKPRSPALQADSLPSQTPGMICNKNSADVDSTVRWWMWLLGCAALSNRSPLTSTPGSAQPRLWNQPHWELGINISSSARCLPWGSAASLLNSTISSMTPVHLRPLLTSDPSSFLFPILPLFLLPWIMDPAALSLSFQGAELCPWAFISKAHPNTSCWTCCLLRLLQTLHICLPWDSHDRWG